MIPSHRHRVHLGILAEMKTVFGATPVLSSEDPKAYDLMLLGLIEDFEPCTFHERMLVRQIADYEWENFRYGRHQTSNIERKYRELQHSKAAAHRQQAQLRKPAETNKEDVTAGTVRDMLQKAPTELDHAEALERGIKHAEALDRLRNAAVARRDDNLDLLARRRATKRTSGIQPLVIDHECNQGGVEVDHEKYRNARMSEDCPELGLNIAEPQGSAGSQPHENPGSPSQTEPSGKKLSGANDHAGG